MSRIAAARFKKPAGWGDVIATLGIYGSEQADLLIRTIERELRETKDEDEIEMLHTWRLQLMRMKPRSVAQEWRGWSDK